MTELVQKGTLPTLEQLDDAGKAVVVNQTGNNYTLGEQSGASALPGTGVGDRLFVYYDSYATTQVFPPGWDLTRITLFDTVMLAGGSTFEWRMDTKDVLVLRDCLVQYMITVEFDPVLDVAVTDANHHPLPKPRFFPLVRIETDPQHRGLANFTPVYPVKGNGLYGYGVVVGPIFAVRAGDVLVPEGYANDGTGTGTLSVTLDYCEISLVNVGRTDPGAEVES